VGGAHGTPTARVTSRAPPHQRCHATQRVVGLSPSAGPLLAGAVGDRAAYAARECSFSVVQMNAQQMAERILARPGPQTRAPASDYHGCDRLPGARCWGQYHPADQTGRRLAPRAAGTHVRLVDPM